MPINLQKLFDTKAAWAVKETSHPPTFYIPPGDIDMTQLQPSGARSTFCEWKGRQVVAACLSQSAAISQPMCSCVHLPPASVYRQARHVYKTPQASGCWRAVLGCPDNCFRAARRSCCTPVEEHTL